MTCSLGHGSRQGGNGLGTVKKEESFSLCVYGQVAGDAFMLSPVQEALMTTQLFSREK